MDHRCIDLSCTRDVGYVCVGLVWHVVGPSCGHRQQVAAGFRLHCDIALFCCSHVGPRLQSAWAHAANDTAGHRQLTLGHAGVRQCVHTGASPGHSSGHEAGTRRRRGQSGPAPRGGRLQNPRGAPPFISLVDVLVRAREGTTAGIIMPWCNNRSLRHVVHKHRQERPGQRPLRLAMTLVLLKDVASGLAHIHACGLVHCDMKEDNILMADDRTTMISDFGLTTPVGSQVPSLGSIAYCCPEVHSLHRSATLHAWPLSACNSTIYSARCRGTGDVTAAWCCAGAPRVQVWTSMPNNRGEGRLRHSCDVLRPAQCTPAARACTRS